MKEIRSSTIQRKGRGFEKRKGTGGGGGGSAMMDLDRGYDTFVDGAEGKYQRCKITIINNNYITKNKQSLDLHLLL